MNKFFKDPEYRKAHNIGRKKRVYNDFPIIINDNISIKRDEYNLILYTTMPCKKMTRNTTGYTQLESFYGSFESIYNQIKSKLTESEHEKMKEIIATNTCEYINGRLIITKEKE